jgi:uncharacterized protein YjbI with pentapeptide repeats
MFQNSERRTTWIVLFLLITVAALSLGSSYYAHSRSNSVDYWSWLDGALQNFSTEMMGAIVTFGLFELILGSQKAKREKAEQIEELQKRLVREAGSRSSNATAKAAVDRLRAEGWLTTGDSAALLKQANLANSDLQGVDLQYANLQQANLNGSNLQQSNLQYANLQQAYLNGTNLQQAYLGSANLRQANIRSVNLQQAYLGSANLQQAFLGNVNLQQANFVEANLKHAWLVGSNLRGAKNMESAIFDEKTVLPDAKQMLDETGDFLVDENNLFVYDKYWTPETDMRRYTDPKYPNFWKADSDYLKREYDEVSKPWWAKKQTED